MRLTLGEKRNDGKMTNEFYHCATLSIVYSLIPNKHIWKNHFFADDNLQFTPTTLTLDSGVTRPPPLLSEADLLSCMDKVRCEYAIYRVVSSDLF